MKYLHKYEKTPKSLLEHFSILNDFEKKGLQGMESSVKSWF